MQHQFSPNVCLDFDLSVELFDLWLEGRQNETVEKNAPAKQKKTIQVPKYKTLRDLLGLVGDHDADFVTSPEENELVDQLLSGEIDLDQIHGIGSEASIADLLNRVRTQTSPAETE